MIEDDQPSRGTALYMWFMNMKLNILVQPGKRYRSVLFTVLRWLFCNPGARTQIHGAPIHFKKKRNTIIVSFCFYRYGKLPEQNRTEHIFINSSYICNTWVYREQSRSKQINFLKIPNFSIFYLENAWK